MPIGQYAKLNLPCQKILFRTVLLKSGLHVKYKTSASDWWVVSICLATVRCNLSNRGSRRVSTPVYLEMPDSEIN